MANPALLDIGTASIRIDLLNPRGFHLSEWRPKALGTDVSFAESALADGRQPAASRDLNVIETFELKLNTFDPDDAARMVQQLRRMLRDGLKYWTSGDPSLVPVYLSARSSCETNTRYALVYDARMPEDDNYYRQPFLQADGDAVMDALSLVVERGPWLENAPGTGTCVQTSTIQSSPGAQTALTDSPDASADDAYICIALGETLQLAATSLNMGYMTAPAVGPTLTGIRFVTVNVPQGATINSAYITFEASNSVSMTTVNLMIYGEDADDAATFSTSGNFYHRIQTTATVVWADVQAWTAASTYDTPDISPIIQEIVDRAGWVALNDMAIFIRDWGSDTDTTHYRRACSWDSEGAAPVLHISYSTTENTYGRAATCTNEVYIANKHNQAQLSHLYHYTDIGAVWSANLMGSATPFAFLPAAIANNDIVYFGINTAQPNTGPFSSLVFDIGTAAIYAGATAALTWQYWNGAWSTLTTRDNTNGGDGPFSETGVNSVHWEQPSDWTTTAINGVTAYWVRAIATIGGGDSISTPTQANRDVYTIVTPRVEIAAAQVSGDMPALAQLNLENQSGVLNAPQLVSNRFILGLRSLDRGEDFTPFINLADEQNPTGILVGVSAATTFATATQAPTGRACYFNSTGALAMASRIIVGLANTIAYQYYGKFRAFVRGWQVAGGTEGNVGVRLHAFTGGSDYYSQTAYFTALNSWQVLDMGEITIPAGLYETTDEMRYNSLIIQASSSSAADDAYFTDLILMPVDEWSGDFLTNNSGFYGYNGYISGLHKYLDVDSIAYPKANIRTSIRDVTDDQVTATGESRCAGPLVLLNGKDQRLWVLSMWNQSGTTIWYTKPEIAHSVQVWRQQRYETLRGAG